MKTRICLFAFYAHFLVFVSPVFAASDFIANIDTSGNNGTSGYLDFQFAGGVPMPPSGTVNFFRLATDGDATSLGIPTGDVRTYKTLPFYFQWLPRSINNTPGYNDYFVPFTYGNLLMFEISFSGPATTSPDPLAGGSSFAFSLLDPAQNPTLVSSLNNPGGFAFTIDLGNDGLTTVNNFMTSGTVVSSPIPAAWTLVAPVVAGLWGRKTLRKAT